MTQQNKATQPNQRADENISPHDVGGGPQRGVAVEGSQQGDAGGEPEPDTLPEDDEDDEGANDDDDDDDANAVEDAQDPDSVI